MNCIVCQLKILLNKKVNVMKKDLIFAPAMLLIGVLLFLLRTTGMTAHIAISVIGLLVLIVYAVLTKKDWKLPALEGIMRAFYGIALITGIVIKMQYIPVLATIHKISAALFVVMLVVLFVHKIFAGKEKAN